MPPAFKEVKATAEQHRVEMRTGAFVPAVSRAEATAGAGYIPVVECGQAFGARPVFEVNVQVTGCCWARVRSRRKYRKRPGRRRYRPRRLRLRWQR
jgi:hypothetical protein